jgi:Leucine-rich repeat (LRR) protein
MATELAAIDAPHEVARLYLGNNTLTKVPDLSNFTNLYWLYLDNNQLKSFPDRVFIELSNLKFLYLGYNQLASLPGGAFNGLSQL